MTPHRSQYVIAGEDLELQAMVRHAQSALHADGILVVDERTAAPRVVSAEGCTADELAHTAEDLSSDGIGEGDVVDRTVDGRRILSTSLASGSGSDIGYLRVIYADGATIPSNVHTLVRAFGRHLGFALDRGSIERHTEHGHGDEAFPWGDLDPLPEAMGDITGQVTEFLRPLTGATAVGINIWDAERGILRALPGAFGATDTLLSASVTGRATNMLSAGARVFVTGQPYLSNHASGDPGILQPYVEVFRIHRILSVPLDRGNRRIGVLHLVNKPTDFTPDDIATVERVAPHVATAVELARTVAQLAAQHRLEGVLTGAAVSIASGKQVEDSLIPAFDQLGAVTEASLVALVPLRSPPLIRRFGSADPELEHRLIVDARELGSASLGAFPHRAGDPGWAALHASVQLYDERMATLSLLRRNGEPFTAAEEGVVSRLARLVGLAWATERYQRQLAEIARLRERERIADELHDRVAQILFAAQLGLDTLLESATPDQTERLVEVRDLLVNGDIAIREVIHRLAAPAPGTNLARRLRLEIESVEEEFGVVVHLELPDDDALCRVPRPIVEAAVKVAREGMVNAAKHAGPCRITLQAHIEADEKLVVFVVDDGLGVRAHTDRSAGLGRHAMRRTVEDVGGTISFVSGGFGTGVLATFPL